MDFGALFGDMQQKLQAVKDNLEASRIDATSPDGLVRVTISGKKKLQEVNIDPALLSAERGEELEDLLVVAINRAQDMADAKAAEAMNEATGGLGGMLPGGLSNLM